MGRPPRRAGAGGATWRWRHGLTALRNHVRPDGSTFHVVDYDPSTGAVLRPQRTRQGAGDDSTWARGQAWAIHGFTTLYTLHGRPALPLRAPAAWPATGCGACSARRRARRGTSTRASCPARRATARPPRPQPSGLLALARRDPDRGRARRWPPRRGATREDAVGSRLSRAGAAPTRCCSTARPTARAGSSTRASSTGTTTSWRRLPRLRRSTSRRPAPQTRRKRRSVIAEPAAETATQVEQQHDDQQREVDRVRGREQREAVLERVDERLLGDRQQQHRERRRP